MAIGSKFSLLAGTRKTDGPTEISASSPPDVETPSAEKTATASAGNKEVGISDNSSDEALPSQHVQTGVQKIQAVTLVWSKWSLVAVFCLYVPHRIPTTYCLSIV